MDAYLVNGVFFRFSDVLMHLRPTLDIFLSKESHLKDENLSCKKVAGFISKYSFLHSKNVWQKFCYISIELGRSLIL